MGRDKHTNFGVKFPPLFLQCMLALACAHANIASYAKKPHLAFTSLTYHDFDNKVEYRLHHACGRGNIDCVSYTQPMRNSCCYRAK